MESLGEIRFQHSFLPQDLDSVLVVARLPKPHLGDDMLGEIEDALAGELEISCRELMDVLVSEELGAAKALEAFELSSIPFERAQAACEHVLIDRSACPPGTEVPSS